MTINGYTGACDCCPAKDCEVFRVKPSPATFWIETFICRACAQAEDDRLNEEEEGMSNERISTSLGL